MSASEQLEAFPCTATRANPLPAAQPQMDLPLWRVLAEELTAKSYQSAMSAEEIQLRRRAGIPL